MGLIGFVGVLLVFVLSIPINGLLISLTWNWFVVPVLHAPSISIVEGVGFSIFWSVFYHRPPTPKTVDDGELAWTLVILAFVPTGVTFVTAWLWHSFFMP